MTRLLLAAGALATCAAGLALGMALAAAKAFLDAVATGEPVED